MNNIKNLKSVGVIGRGKWGQIVIKALKSCSSIKYIVGKNVNFKKCSTKVDWIFILTPNRTHYRMCEFFLKKKVNVFCEKPLTLNLKQATNLYSLAKKNRVLLYVDDVEIYKQKKFVLLKKNFITREKKDKGNLISLIDRLFYHDAYLIYDKINKHKTKIKILSNNSLKFSLTFNRKLIFFFYNINASKKKHMINSINFLTFKGDPLKKMINHVLYKLKNHTKNKKRSLFAIKMCVLLKSYFK
tara:strand:+ start:203 stop:931 length:729 start_codon:yes stop_codon:yes gene_type:complete